MKDPKRKVELAVISDVHLGTYGCHARELVKYLKSIDPETLILNGDIIDGWQFSKKYWPVDHNRVIRQILKMITRGTRVVYITGNHDEMLRKYAGMELDGFELVNHLILDLGGKKTWFFHGDVFDVTMKHSKWLAQLGGKGYDLLIVLNRVVNDINEKMGGGRISLSRKVKNSVKSAVNFVSDFESTIAEMAVMHGYDTVVCGHIHQPEMREVAAEKGSVNYLNSGDWIENLSALEYDNGEWRLMNYWDEFDVSSETVNDEEMPDLSYDIIFSQMVGELEIGPIIASKSAKNGKLTDLPTNEIETTHLIK